MKSASVSKEISILTDPLVTFCSSAKYSLRRLYLSAKQYTGAAGIVYRGHFAVTRSLVNGFKVNNISYNYNPVRLGDLGGLVIVLAGVDTLRQAIDLKRQGYIKTLYAGPNIVEFSSDAQNILNSNEIDLVLTPSPWVSKLYCEDHSSLKDKCYSWAAGVDIDYWVPKDSSSQVKLDKKVLIYSKTKKKADFKLIDDVNHFLQSKGYLVKVLDYGSYNHMEYKAELNEACLLIGFTNGSESQGLAWAESWSMDVPTLILKNVTQNYRGREFECSTAPYLADDNGSFFIDYADFKNQFLQWEEGKKTYSPRNWVKKNMTDSVCSLTLYRRLKND
jgi:hypothetical protein